MEKAPVPGIKDDSQKKIGQIRTYNRAGDGDPIRSLNATLDWGNTNIMSLGEQQRLTFGRLVCCN
jgi:ABC-type uncharacterized transport system fused permease/ATPase subunit